MDSLPPGLPPTLPTPSSSNFSVSPTPATLGVAPFTSIVSPVCDTCSCCPWKMRGRRAEEEEENTCTYVCVCKMG